MSCFVRTIYITAAVLCAAPAFAQIGFSGSGGAYYSPAGSWNASTQGYIGYEATGTPAYGTMTVSGGATQTSESGILGGYSSSYSNVTGNVSIDGTSGATPSTWDIAGTTNGSFIVGYYGTGNLSITNGANLTTSSGYAYCGYWASSKGTITVDGMGGPTAPSTWDAGGLVVLDDPSVAAGSSGALNVTNGAYVNASGSVYVYTATGVIDVNGINATYGVPSKLNASGSFQDGGGFLTITNGGEVATTGPNNIIYGRTGSPGLATVAGAGSTWTSGPLTVGYDYTGSLAISSGGTVSATSVTIGSNTNGTTAGTGSVTVEGPGASLNVTSGGSLKVGGSVGPGTMILRGGATVSAPTAYLGAASTGLLSIDAGSSLTVAGTLEIGNGAGGGTLQLVAGADAAAATYTPVTAATWATGSGPVVYQPLGGTWNSGTHQFTVASAVSATGAGGAKVSLTPSGANQRALISDSAAGTSLGVGFLATESALTVTGTTLSGAPLLSLQSVLSAGQAVLDGWALSTTGGYTAGDPAYLSESIGAGLTPYELSVAGYTVSNLSVWDYNGSAWSQFTADDLTFDGTYASFTATALGGCDYAVVGTPIGPGDANRDGRVDVNDLTIVLSHFGETGCGWSQGGMDGDPTGRVDVNDLTIVLANFGKTDGSPAAGLSAVPEPGAMGLLAAGAAGLLAWAWRKRK